MVERPNTIWRDFATNGAPSSGAHKPRKAEIRAWGEYIQAFLDGGVFLGYTTKAALDADLDHAAGTLAIVYGESAANDGLYLKSGESGAGAWARIGNVPGYPFELATDNGGTANAIAATLTSTPDTSKLIVVPVEITNTATPVTVAFNGGTALTIKTNSGNNPAVGGLTAGSRLLGIIDGSYFRLFSDQTSAAIQAASEAAQTASEAARDLAQDYASNSVDASGLLPRYASVASLLADTDLYYSGGTGAYEVSTGVKIWADRFIYEVAASGASDHHLTTAGGVKLYALPDKDGVSLLACGAVVNTDTTDAANANIAALETALDAGSGKAYASPDTYHFGEIPGDTQLIERTAETIIDWKNAHIIVDGITLVTSTTSTAFLEVTGAKLVSKNWRFTDRNFDLDASTIYRGAFAFAVIADGADIDGCEFGPFHCHNAQAPFSLSSLDVTTGRVRGAKTVGACICDDVYYGCNAFGASDLTFDAVIDRAHRFLSLRGIQNSRFKFVGRDGVASSSNLLITHQNDSGDTDGIDIDCVIGTLRGAIAIDASEDETSPTFKNIRIKAKIDAIAGAVTSSTHLVGTRQYDSGGVTLSSGDYVIDGLDLDIECPVRMTDGFRAFTVPASLGLITYKSNQRLQTTRLPANISHAYRHYDNNGLRRGAVGTINVQTLAFPVSKIRGQGGYRAEVTVRVDGYSGGVSAAKTFLVFTIDSGGNVSALSVLGTGYKFDDAAAGGNRTFTYTASGGNIVLTVTGYTAGTTMEVVGEIRLLE